MLRPFTLTSGNWGGVGWKVAPIPRGTYPTFFSARNAAGKILASRRR
jgi:hypothetical protein